VNNYRDCGVYSLEPLADVYYVRLHFNISNIWFVGTVIFQKICSETVGYLQWYPDEKQEI